MFPFFCFFVFERDVFYFKLKSVWESQLNSSPDCACWATLIVCADIFRGRRSTSFPLVEMRIWPLRPYASVLVRKVLVSVVLVSVRVLKIKRRLTSSQFELREVRALRQTPSRSLEDLESDHAQRQTQLTPESHHSMNNYYTSITKVLPELEPRLSRNNLCFGKHLSQ